jgi:predicted RNA-binding protein YlxR (DUF448 family)
MGRGGRRDETQTGSLRRCIATGRELPKAALVRFVIGPDDAVVPDLEETLPGRGIWVSADAAALRRAASKGLFARAARRRVQVPEGLVADVESGLVRRVTSLVSLARKAGGAVAGYEKARDAVRTGWAAAFLQASDGSARGKTKLRLPPEDGPTIGCLTAQELGLSFGRERVIHAALGGGGLTARIVQDAGRLAGLRASIGETSPERMTNSHERQ